MIGTVSTPNLLTYVQNDRIKTGASETFRYSTYLLFTIGLQPPGARYLSLAGSEAVKNENRNTADDVAMAPPWSPGLMLFGQYCRAL